MRGEKVLCLFCFGLLFFVCDSGCASICSNRSVLRSVPKRSVRLRSVPQAICSRLSLSSGCAPADHRHHLRAKAACGHSSATDLLWQQLQGWLRGLRQQHTCRRLHLIGIRILTRGIEGTCGCTILRRIVGLRQGTNARGIQAVRPQIPSPVSCCAPAPHLDSPNRNPRADRSPPTTAPPSVPTHRRPFLPSPTRRIRAEQRTGEAGWSTAVDVEEEEAILLTTRRQKSER